MHLLHSASRLGVDDFRRAIAMEAVENVLDTLAGLPPRGAINYPSKARN
ncbi:MAG: hypothetical protein ACREV0_09110 [Burkholderiales bacterium]